MFYLSFYTTYGWVPFSLSTVFALVFHASIARSLVQYRPVVTSFSRHGPAHSTVTRSPFAHSATFGGFPQNGHGRSEQGGGAYSLFISEAP